MNKKEWVLTKEQIAKSLRDSNEKFDLYYNICTGAIEMFEIVNMTSFSVHMALIEATLRDGKKEANPKTMRLLCDLMIKLAKEYHPNEINEATASTSVDSIEACQQVWGMTRDEALKWLESDAGCYIRAGGEERWMSGAVIKSLLDKVQS